MSEEPTSPDHPEPHQAPDSPAPMDSVPPAEPVVPASGAPAPVLAPMEPAPLAPAATTSGSAIVALVLAIASWVSCPIVPAIVALVFASKADREIAVGAGRVSGAGLVTAAKIVAWINIGTWLAVIVVGVFLLMLAVISGSWS